MTSDRSRDELGRTFDRAADVYQRARPEYPDELFDDLVAVPNLKPRDRLLEIGCATGKATLPLARRGFRIVALEPGPALAKAARQNVGGLDVEVVERRFEEWRPRPARSFDLVFAATSWNWVDPAVRYRKAWEALRPGGHLAFWNPSHVFPSDGDPFFREIQAVYEEIGEGLPPGSRSPRPGELEEQGEEVEASGVFEMIHVRHFDWERVYDVEGYIELLDTFSGHIAMEAWKRDRLYSEIRARLRRRSDGLVRRHWGAVLHIARRRD